MTQADPLETARASRMIKLVAVLLAALGPLAALAQAAAVAPVAPAPDLWTQSTLLGQLGGLRPWLKTHGISFGLTEADELWDNTTGGLRRGPVFDGLAEASLMIDTAKAFGWQGGTFDAQGSELKLTMG